MQENKSFAELSQGKFTIADVFCKAQHYLSDEDPEVVRWQSQYSCDTIRSAIYDLLGYPEDSRYGCPWQERDKVEELEKIIRVGIAEMGLNPHGISEYSDLEDKEKQQARSIWLAWCQMMAEEQGV